MTQYAQFKIAAVQSHPIYFDREASTEKACHLIQEAGGQGASLAAFGETWLPGYPFFVWGSLTPAMEVEYLANAVEIPSATTDRLCEAARQANIDVVIGMAERDSQTKGTVYCTLLFIGNDGTILGRHRKLKPTHRERTVWGEGDGSSLTVYDRPYGRISGLNCWEHNMVLPGYALMSQGTQIHIAAWPGQHQSLSRHIFLSRAFASQAAAYVIAVGSLLSTDRIREEYKDLANSVPEAYRGLIADFGGESCIIDPSGEVIAGPAEGETILIADCSMEDIYAAKGTCDVGGHYSRPDVFQLNVNRTSYDHGHAVQEQRKDHEAVESEMAPEDQT